MKQPIWIGILLASAGCAWLSTLEPEPPLVVSWHRGSPALYQDSGFAKIAILPSGDSEFDRCLEERMSKQTRWRVLPTHIHSGGEIDPPSGSDITELGRLVGAELVLAPSYHGSLIHLTAIEVSTGKRVAEERLDYDALSTYPWTDDRNSRRRQAHLVAGCLLPWKLRLVNGHMEKFWAGEDPAEGRAGDGGFASAAYVDEEGSLVHALRQVQTASRTR